MEKHKILLPSSDAIKLHVTNALISYWSQGAGPILVLPVKSFSNINLRIPLQLAEIEVPSWANSCSINGKILIPKELCEQGNYWAEIDWWLAAFLMMEAWHERLWEEKYGPIHSFGGDLKGWDDRVWEYAWVNRIALFFRLWAEYKNSIRGDVLLGALPKPEIFITHDVDAINKTFAIRVKQGVFNLINVYRLLIKFQLREAIEKWGDALRFLFGLDDWWKLDEMLNIEESQNISATYNFYAGRRPKNFKQWLFDPGYDISSTKIQLFINRLHKSQQKIGLHAGFDSWNSYQSIKSQKETLESITKVSCISCRQHWLRFSWRETWASQTEAGILEDTTLMFNDRPGFRASTAISWRPWNSELECKHKLFALPTVLMDSHIYDYQQLSILDRRLTIERLIKEVFIVKGKVAVVWHPHTLAKDYGWREGFVELVSIIRSFSHA